MRKKYVLGNWKMNHGLTDIKNFIEKFNFQKDSTYIGVCPQSLHLAMAKNLSHFHLKIGAQISSYENHGAFTGEISPKALKELGIDFTLIGHSERRQFFGETNQSCLKRTKKAYENNLLSIFCIGESFAEFENNQTLNILSHQLKEGLFPILDTVINNIVIAYEPVWAIGTGKTATNEIIENTLTGIRKILREHSEKAANTSLLYGGSVNGENAKSIASIANVDGVLVGGASLKTESFTEIAKAF